MKYLIFTLFVTIIGCSNWDWKPDPYVADYISQGVINANGDLIYAYDPAFDDFTCFTSQDIADLKYNIEKLKINDRAKTQILSQFNSFEKKTNWLKKYVQK